MAVRKYKPTSNGRRNMSVLTYDEITTDTPEKSLLAPKHKHAGRNNTGRITVRPSNPRISRMSGASVKSIVCGD